MAEISTKTHLLEFSTVTHVVKNQIISLVPDYVTY